MTFDSLFFLGGMRKGEKNNQSRGQNSCLSARSVKEYLKFLQKKISSKLNLAHLDMVQLTLV